jgi:hypothetical protein
LTDRSNMHNTLESINLRTFNKALPFDNETNPLHWSVNSDHATIKCKVEYTDGTSVVVSASNISNKEYHKYNKNGPLFKTHMYVETNDSEWLLKKTQFQMDQLLSEIATMDVQIILEGFYDFFDEMQQQKNPYELVSLLDDPAHKFKGTPKNIAGILVNTSKVSIKERGIETIQYDVDKQFKSPWVRIKTQNGHELIIVAIHLPGNDAQFPEAAIRALCHTLKKCKEMSADVIAIGDFNTVPENIEKVATPEFSVLEPKYLTHFNPYNQVAVYDNALYHLQSAETRISFMDSKSLPDDSFRLIEGLNNSFLLNAKT